MSLGKYLYVADTLLRAYDKDNITQGNDMHDDMENMVHYVAFFNSLHSEGCLSLLIEMVHMP